MYHAVPEMAVRRWSVERERQCSTPAPVVLAERQWGGAQTDQGGCTPKGEGGRVE